MKKLENDAEKIIMKTQEEMDLDKKPVNLIASLVSSLQKDENVTSIIQQVQKLT